MERMHRGTERQIGKWILLNYHEKIQLILCSHQKRNFDSACFDMMRNIMEYEDYLEECKVPFGALTLWPNENKSMIVGNIVSSFEDVIDALAAFILQNGYEIPVWLKTWFPSISNLEEVFENREGVEYHEYTDF